jgi:hypothetical protein
MDFGHFKNNVEPESLGRVKGLGIMYAPPPRFSAANYKDANRVETLTAFIGQNKHPMPICAVITYRMVLIPIVEKRLRGREEGKITARMESCGRHLQVTTAQSAMARKIPRQFGQNRGLYPQEIDL